MKLFLAIFIMSFGFASTLEEQVDALTPEEAFRIMNKLKAKQYEPIPEGFFTKLSLSTSFGIQSSKQDDFYSSVNSKFSDDDNHEMPSFFRASLLWHYSEKVRLGIGFGIFGNELTKETSTGVFEEVNLSGSYLQLEASRIFNLSQKLSLLPMIGVGFLQADAMTKKSDDNTESTYLYEYEGADLMASAVIGLNYKLNKVFHIGVEGGYLYSVVDDLKRSGEVDISNPSELDFGGPFWGLRLTINQ